MKICYSCGVVIRHLADESLVWCPRTGGCTVLRNCRQILDEIRNTWREVEEIVQALALKFDCAVVEFHDDFMMVLRELQAQGFVVCIGEKGDEPSGIASDEEAAQLLEQGDGSPLEDFYRKFGMATDLHIDLTDSCTERCVHCYVPKGQKDFLPAELVEKALAEFRVVNGLTVHLTGGEAMMHPDFERICRKCVELNLNFIIFSNMTLCSEARIAFLKEVRPQFVNVSLYSMDPEVHDSITQLPGSWRRTMAAILRCCENGVACRIATPLLKANQDSLPSLRRFADEHRLHLIPTVGIIAQADHNCENLAQACSRDELRRVLVRDRGLFHKTYDGVRPAINAKVCDIGEARIYLSAKGNYYPCDSMHEYVLGNVRENTIEEIWKGEKLDYLRALRNRDFGVCANCSNRPWCKVCLAANFNATGDLFSHPQGACSLAEVVRDVYGNGNDV